MSAGPHRPPDDEIEGNASPVRSCHRGRRRAKTTRRATAASAAEKLNPVEKAPATQARGAEPGLSQSVRQVRPWVCRGAAAAVCPELPANLRSLSSWFASSAHGDVRECFARVVPDARASFDRLEASSARELMAGPNFQVFRSTNAGLQLFGAHGQSAAISLAASFVLRQPLAIFADRSASSLRPRALINLPLSWAIDRRRPEANDMGRSLSR